LIRCQAKEKPDMRTEPSVAGDIDPTIPPGYPLAAAGPASSSTILIAEDDDDLVNLLQFRLHREGFETVIAKDGIEACRLLEEEEVDLLLLDILMPGMDGWEVCRRLRGHGNRRIASVPVIMLTALSAGENRIKGLECGADAYLTKPYAIQEVVLNSRRLIKERRERLRLASELEALRRKEEGNVEGQRELFDELRSQFMMIGGLCQRMLQSDGPLQLSRPAGETDSREVIGSCANQVSEITDELRLLSRLRGNDLELPRAECRLDEIVAEVLVAFNARARLKGIDLVVSPMPSQPVTLHRLALKIILSSLLANALKYSPPGSAVVLQISVVGAALRLEVRDHGPGIPLAEQEKIFKPFYRGETTRASHQGSGLGLYSVKRLTEALGGVVKVISTPGNGSLFSVIFDS
jgi:two-component system sensor histidine kinase/response regulator